MGLKHFEGDLKNQGIEEECTKNGACAFLRPFSK